MTQFIKDLFDPMYFATVFPVGLAYLGYYWHKDSKEIEKMKEDG